MNDHTPKQDAPSDPVNSDDLPQKSIFDNDQNAQARLVLIQLQWLITILLVTAMLWLGSNQSKLAQSVNDRLQIADDLNARMNDLDDRLFAVSPSTPMPQNDRNAENDWQLINIQLSSASRLNDKGDYTATKELLKLVLWQLNHEKLNLATPLKNALAQGIKDDLVRLDSLQNHSDLWQLQALKMQEIQRFLRTQMSSDELLDKNELALQNAHSMLTLAISASQLHQKDSIRQHLYEVLRHLEWLQKYGKLATNTKTDIKTDTKTENASETTAKPKPTTSTTKDDNHTKTAHSLPHQKIENLDEAIFAVNELIANPPTFVPLTSVQILKR